MKTPLLGSKFRSIKNSLLAATALSICGSLNTVNAQTIDIGPNQYAFQFTGNPNFGLFFNSTSSQYEFRNGSASPIFAIGAANGQMRSNLTFGSGSDFLVDANRYAFRYSGDTDFGLYFNDTDSRYEFRNGGANAIFGFSALNGRMTTDLQFDGSASYKIAPNNYAMRSAANTNIGIYFGASDYEFRNAAGNSVLTINANTGEMVSTAGITADGGNSAEWSEAHSWGDHAVAGYINAESDPKIGSLTNNSIPAWNGSELSGSALTSISNGIEVEGSSGRVSINSDGFLGGTSKLGFSNLDSENGYIQMGLGLMQIMNTTDFGSIAFGNNNVLHSAFDEEGRLGINTTSPASRLSVVGESNLTESIISSTVTYVGNNDVRAINAQSISNPGYGYGVYAEGGYMGVRAFSDAGNYNGTTYGMYGNATGTAGTRIGVFGSASGGSENWAMFAQGDSYVSGDLRIGNQADVSGFRLSVDGNVICEELKVQMSSDWPDYVFADDYSMLDLNDLKEFIETEKHLPGIPSAAAVKEADGVMLGEMQRLTVEKLEELTLYILELKKENDQLKERIEALEN